MRTLKWWAIFVADVLLCVLAASVAGAIFAVQAFVEDVRFAWRRPRSEW